MTGRFSFMHMDCFNSTKESESLMAELLTPVASEQHYVQAGQKNSHFMTMELQERLDDLTFGIQSCTRRTLNVLSNMQWIMEVWA